MMATNRTLRSRHVDFLSVESVMIFFVSTIMLVFCDFPN